MPRFGDKQVHPYARYSANHGRGYKLWYIQRLVDGVKFKQTAYALDRDSRKAAWARFLKRASRSAFEDAEEGCRLAA